MTTTENPQEIDDDVKKVIRSSIGTDDPENCLVVEQSDGELKYRFTDEKDIKIFDRDLKVDEGCGIITNGSTAIVIQCYESWDDYRREYALKFPRPEVLTDDEWEIDSHELKENRTEARKQGRLSHPNVTYLVGTADIPLPVDPEPRGTILLQEWIEGAKPLDEYVYPENDDDHEDWDDDDDQRENSDPSDAIVDLEELVGLFIDVFNGLAHIHEKNLVHWDVKSGNCLVDQKGTVKISDVGNAREKGKNLDNEGPVHYEEDTNRYTSKKCLPSDAPYIEGDEGSNRVDLPIRSGDLNLDQPWLDLCMAGRMMVRICGLESAEVIEDDIDDSNQELRERFRNHVFKSDEPHADMTERYLNEIAIRLLKPFDNITFDDENKIGGDPDPYYATGHEVVEDLKKLLHEFGDATEVPELYPVPQESIRIPVTSGTEFSARIEELAKTTPARRLREHKQLGLARFAYPGARHSRFEHILGTVGTTLEYIRALYSDRTNPAFRLLCDSRHVSALIFAAAVHDMGHGAFSHYIEEKEPLFRGCTHQDYIQAVLRDDPSYYAGSQSEALSGHLAEDRKELEKIVKKDWIKRGTPHDYGEDEESAVNNFMLLVANILRPTEMAGREWDENEDFEPKLWDRDESKEATIWILHSILESAFDADKLDYLRRDAWHAGLNYPKGADVDRFLQSLTVTTSSPTKETKARRSTVEDDEAPGFRPTIAVNQRGVDPLESLLLARYQVHKTLYWHRDVRAAVTLLKNQVWRYLVESSTHDRLYQDPYNEDSFENRREELLDTFRKEDDESAVDWLLNKRRDWNPDEDIQRYADTLIDCAEIPIAVIDVGEGMISDDQEEKLSEIIEAHEYLNRLDWDDYSMAREKIIEDAGVKLKEKLEEEGLDNDLDIGQGSLFIDVPVFSDAPVANMSQIENLFVVDRRLMVPRDQSSRTGESRHGNDIFDGSDPLGPSHEIRDFEEFSAMGKDLKDAINHWARPIRVFIWEEDLDTHILDEINIHKRELANHVIDSLHHAYVEEPPAQLE